MPPAVSVVMAVFNGDRYLPETLASLRAQTFADFEIIVVDDGSTDDTARILADFAGQDGRCRIITQTNQGQVAARNLGAAQAAAPLLAWLDADDVAEPERLAKQTDYLRVHPEIAALGSALRIIDATSTELSVQPYPVGSVAVANRMLEESALAHSAVMMRREVFLKIGGYRSAFLHAEDYDLWLRLLDRYAADNLPEPLVRYRQHADSLSFRSRRQQSLAAFAARYAARARRAGKPDPFINRALPINGEIFGELSVTSADEAAFRFACLTSCLNPAGQAIEDAWITENLQRSWALRRHLPRGRYVRRCLIPYAHRAWNQGRRGEALGWLWKAITRAPLTACWRFLRGG